MTISVRKCAKRNDLNLYLQIITIIHWLKVKNTVGNKINQPKISWSMICKKHFKLNKFNYCNVFKIELAIYSVDA